jgi:hypothetical protein
VHYTKYRELTNIQDSARGNFNLHYANKSIFSVFEGGYVIFISSVTRTPFFKRVDISILKMKVLTVTFVSRIDLCVHKRSVIIVVFVNRGD